MVTATMVRTSPLLKGRSCSAVPWKLYLAMHSVPDGHTAWGGGKRGGCEPPVWGMPPTPSRRGAARPRVVLTCIPDIFSGGSGARISREGHVTRYHETCGGKGAAEKGPPAGTGTAPWGSALRGWVGNLRSHKGFLEQLLPPKKPNPNPKM